MSDLSTPNELLERLAQHTADIERRAAEDSGFEPYAVLGLHADVRPYLDNWASYNTEQRTVIAETVNYITQVADPFADAGADGYDDDRAMVAELPGRIKALADPE
ncbi:hypothetical protein [Cumulibacter manganitolerans]|uniref:hypothetical protein n=1 Tax=Cumulibacter manganitolerans TaxID=1884992 RepID=UPI00129508A6|nr:hypothetical protein [Cumulibacter manganitolerans]